MNAVFPIRLLSTSSLFHRLSLFFLLFFSYDISFADTGTYHLDISFQPEKHTLQGEAVITFPAGENWQLHTGSLAIEEIFLAEEGGKKIPLPLPQGESIRMYGGAGSQQVTIRYSKTITTDASDNLISPRGIALTSNWHPLPQRDMIFSLNASLPPGFLGISESDSGAQQQGTVLKTSFSQPVQSIHLAAGPYQVEEAKVRDGLSLSTWFFAEEAELSGGYLDAAKQYILRYEKEIGPFPYNHYAIVSNRLASGFGMPTFTLLGQMVLRLPFIKETSLGHEILHSWFGNSTSVAEGSGNWCEGLTSYLADFQFATEKGTGAEHRKASLVNYGSYVHPEENIPLADFYSASHNQPMARAVRAVGYNRGAMFFHQLRGLLGPESFYQGLRDFAASHRGKEASWEDIRKSFETSSGKELTRFFTEQLGRRDLPELAVKDIRTESRQDSSRLHFTIVQNSEEPYLLKVPIRVSSVSGEQNFSREITEKETVISLSLKDPPLSFRIDPDYDLFRALSPAEQVPSWSRFLGARDRLLILGDKAAATDLGPIIRWAEKQGWTVMDSDSVSNQQLSENSLLFLGTEGESYRSLFGKADPAGEGFSLEVHSHPLNEEEVVVVTRSSSEQESERVLHKLKHYGKYSTLSFQKGRIQEKEIRPSEQGLYYQLEELPAGGSTATLETFEQIISKLAENRVIYLGERHNSLADHILQLRVIQHLQKQGLDLVVALEMFPGSSQGVLDEYILAEPEMDEATFLRQSRWFEVWRHDWRLFRPIFNYCRRQKIPIHGINVDKEIVSKVFADGHTDNLSTEQLESLASERDLGLDGYVERLRLIHAFHAAAPHGQGKGVSGFIQSQAIWDESMAEGIVAILENNPAKTVVVIAGSQHTRKDSGIPPRVQRRMDVKQASVLNLYGVDSPLDPGEQADYFFMAAGGSLEEKGKIGVILSPEKDEDGQSRLRISDISHAGKAGAAGIMKDDIILTINDSPARDMGDIGILMMDSRPGETLQLTVQRKDEAGEPVELEFKVELSDLSKPAGHP